MNALAASLFEIEVVLLCELSLWMATVLPLTVMPWIGTGQPEPVSGRGLKTNELISPVYLLRFKPLVGQTKALQRRSVEGRTHSR